MDLSGYIFERRRDGPDVWLNMSRATKAGMSFNALERLARAEGWSYRRADMQADYRRFGSIEKSNTPEARERARRWFDDVFTPVQKVMKQPMKKVTQALRDARYGDAERRNAIFEGLDEESAESVWDYMDYEGSA